MPQKPWQCRYLCCTLTDSFWYMPYPESTLNITLTSITFILCFHRNTFETSSELIPVYYIANIFYYNYTLITISNCFQLSHLAVNYMLKRPISVSYAMLYAKYLLLLCGHGSKEEVSKIFMDLLKNNSGSLLCQSQIQTPQ